MSIPNYKDVPKSSVEEMIKKAVNSDYIASEPIEHYSIEEIKRMAELAKDNKLVLSIRDERSNFYQGILINLVRRELTQGKDTYVRHI